MRYINRKKRLLESLLVKETDSSFSDLLPADKIMLTKEEELEDETEKLIAEVFKQLSIRNGRKP